MIQCNRWCFVIVEVSPDWNFAEAQKIPNFRLSTEEPRQRVLTFNETSITKGDDAAARTT